MYEALLAHIQETVARSVYLVPQALGPQPRRQPRLQAMRPRVPGEQGAVTTRRQAQPVQDPSRQSLKRNDPCWCGSDKKYKNCHMRQDMAGRGQAEDRGRSQSHRRSEAPGRSKAQRGPATTTQLSQTPKRKRRRRR
jgi:hypothetical protein